MTTEHLEQVKFVTWFRSSYPEIELFAIPNGGHRHPITARKLKAEGVRRGVPDLFIPSLKIWIEMKKDSKQKPSSEQIKMMEYLTKVGYTCIIGYSFIDAKEKIILFLEKNACKNSQI
jgi:hypothetical protein